MRPLSLDEEKRVLRDLREFFIKDVTKGKKSSWKELTFHEKREVNRKVELHFHARLYY